MKSHNKYIIYYELLVIHYETADLLHEDLHVNLTFVLLRSAYPLCFEKC